MAKKCKSGEKLINGECIKVCTVKNPNNQCLEGPHGIPLVGLRYKYTNSRNGYRIYEEYPDPGIRYPRNYYLVPFPTPHYVRVDALTNLSGNKDTHLELRDVKIVGDDTIERDDSVLAKPHPRPGVI